jgi:hypothetical protein
MARDRLEAGARREEAARVWCLERAVGLTDTLTDTTLTWVKRRGVAEKERERAAAKERARGAREGEAADARYRQVVGTALESDGYSQFRLGPLGGGAVEASQLVVRLGGPVLVTAPHGLRLFRVHHATGARVVHQREKHATEICLLLARDVASALGCEPSFVVWNPRTAKPLDPGNRDPNFLSEADFGSDPWHAALAAFRDRCARGVRLCARVQWGF